MGLNPARCLECDLSGTVAIVTGAGRGLGHDIALGLAKYGANLVVCSRTHSELEKVADEIRTLGRKVLVHPLDIRRISEIQPMVEAGVKAFGQIDILVNNAGVNIPQWAVEVTEDAWDQIITINLKGVFFCAQAVGKIMIPQRKGKIINVSSQSGSVGLRQRAAYCASKGAVNLLTKVLAIEWARYNIFVNAVAPTFVETPLTAPMFEEEGFHHDVLQNIPLGRLGKPEDVTGAVLYLASDASNMVTGHILLVDGGWTVH